MTDDLKFYSYHELVLWFTKIVEEKGADYVYRPMIYDSETEGMVFGYSGDCQYWDHNEKTGSWSPSCVVGHFFEKAGLVDVSSSIFDPYWNQSGLGTMIEKEGSNLYAKVDGLEFSTDAPGYTFMRKIQEYQDNEVPWGVALNTAITETEELYPLFSLHESEPSE
jgi:hypothetical protein